MKKAIIVILFMGLIGFSFAGSTSNNNNKTKVSSAQRHAALNNAKKYLNLAKKYSRYASNPAYAEKMRQYIAGAEGALSSGGVSQSDPNARSIYKELADLRKQIPAQSQTPAASGGTPGTQAMDYNQAMAIYNSAVTRVLPRLEAVDKNVYSMSKADLQKHISYMNYVKGKLAGAQQFLAAKPETKNNAKKLIKVSENIDKYIAKASKAAAKAK